MDQFFGIKIALDLYCTRLSAIYPGVRTTAYDCLLNTQDAAWRHLGYSRSYLLVYLLVVVVRIGAPVPTVGRGVVGAGVTTRD